MSAPGIKNADIMQSFLSDDLMYTPQSISDVKQVLEFMEGVSQPLTEPQVKALILLDALGNNKDLHNKNPYTDIIKSISGDYKKSVAQTSVYLDTIQELVPKPPRPIILADGKAPKGGR